MTDNDGNDGANNSAEEKASSLQADMVALMGGGEVQDEDSPEDTKGEETETEETETTDEVDEEAEEEDEPEEHEGDPTAAFLKQLEGMSPEEIKDLGKKLGSKSLSRFGELTYRAKAAEEELLRFKSQQQEQPAISEPVQSRLLEGIETAEQLTEKVTALKKLKKQVEGVLDDHEDHALSDVIDIGGESHTKRQLKAFFKEIDEALTEAVPSKQAEFQRMSAIEADTRNAIADAKAVPGMEDAESEVAQNFKTLTDSPHLKRTEKEIPEMRPILPLLAAWASYGITAARKQGKPAAKAATPGVTLKAKPPASPATVAAAPVKQPNKVREIDQLKAKAEKSGSSADVEALLMARIK